MAAALPKKITDTGDFANVTDIISLIQSNAEVLYPAAKDLRIISGTSQQWHYAAVAGPDPKSASVKKDFKVLVQGPSESTRRSSLMKLLEEVEKRVGKEIMKR